MIAITCILFALAHTTATSIRDIDARVKLDNDSDGDHHVKVEVLLKNDLFMAVTACTLQNDCQVVEKQSDIVIRARVLDRIVLSTFHATLRELTIIGGVHVYRVSDFVNPNPPASSSSLVRVRSPSTCKTYGPIGATWMDGARTAAVHSPLFNHLLNHHS